jgi:hypothetical protein
MTEYRRRPTEIDRRRQEAKTSDYRLLASNSISNKISRKRREARPARRALDMPFPLL